ncbi:hypothetical protein FZEAL_8623 [Fusarium zealandicum]|uniref:Uncharacterized protein n=1 Tax=Fusarium zealandicum TaxID=1053134 RepID=A0A8H4UDN2_9HYPO|nr:hypothetical protein FZEAL_8623 [Fusarium zealandicum]
MGVVDYLEIEELDEGGHNSYTVTETDDAVTGRLITLSTLALAIIKIGLEPTVSGSNLGPFWGTLAEAVTIRYRLSAENGEITAYIKNGDKVWFNLNGEDGKIVTF